MVYFSETQKKRLLELGGNKSDCDCAFDSAAERDNAYRQAERQLIASAKARLDTLRFDTHRPALLRLIDSVTEALTGEGFTQVATPIIIAKSSLERMTITDEHHLSSQVFWVDSTKCLRPMLAPNLYSVSIDLMRIWGNPVRIFEIGSCFRKESQGSRHLNEFTMCNLVEWGTPVEERHRRIEYLASVMMQAAGIQDYAFENDESDVYGTTIDVVQGDIELASGSMGPHSLDANWGIDSSWVGLGFGLERLLMTRDKTNNIHSVGRSLTYLDGVRLNIK